MTYSECMRWLRKEHSDKVIEFEQLFQRSFYDVLEDGSDNPEKDALEITLKLLFSDSHSLDIVDVQRMNFYPAAGPAVDNAQMSGWQHSFAPYEDPDQLSVSLASETIKVYKWSNDDNVMLSEQLWGLNISEAKKIVRVPKKDLNLYVAELDGSSNFIEINENIDNDLVNEYMMRGYDFILFNDGAYIIDPDVLLNVNKLEFGDVNNLPLVGQRDNYQGLRQHVYPGTAGFMGGAGGAGFVEQGLEYQF